MSEWAHSLIDNTHVFFSCVDPAIRNGGFLDDSIYGILEPMILSHVDSSQVHTVVMDLTCDRDDPGFIRVRIAGIVVPNELAAIYKLGSNGHTCYSKINGLCIKDYKTWSKAVIDLLHPVKNESICKA